MIVNHTQRGPLIDGVYRLEKLNDSNHAAARQLYSALADSAVTLAQSVAQQGKNPDYARAATAKSLVWHLKTVAGLFPDAPDATVKLGTAMALLGDTTDASFGDSGSKSQRHGIRVR